MFSFRRPRTNTCKTCGLLDCKIKLKNEESAMAKQQLDLHYRKTEKISASPKDLKLILAICQWIYNRKRVVKSFLPEDLIAVVKSARVITHFQVVEIEKNDFHDIQAAADKVMNISKLHITNVVTLRYEAKVHLSS
ncbi:hypothetical protein NQ314_016925 [Rhamnusium bicolor]|uniref:Uncharacterized protein n=1 Tax=Rhamnusium bicolor TaxID=1586634 RepID=A0AAV8WUM6_9CUCU|nr:hypothetical protein NQ314_016925 [Rhamnusium bicolor]